MNFYIMVCQIMIREFLKRLGGAAQVAELLSEQTGQKISRERVAMWATSNNVPYRWRACLIRLARAGGQSVPKQISEGVIVERPSVPQPIREAS